MIRHFLVALLISLIVPCLCNGQVNNGGQWMVGIKSSFQTTWWIHHKGTDKSTGNGLGWDRSHYNPNIGLAIELTYAKNDWQFHFSPGYSALIEDDLLEHEDYVPFRRKIPVSNGVVSFLYVGAGIGYKILSFKSYSMNIQTDFGTFDIKTTHPEKENFGFRSYWTVNLKNVIERKTHNIFFAPIYQEMKILPKNPTGLNERHHFYGFGFNLGVQLKLNTHE